MEDKSRYEILSLASRIRGIRYAMTAGAVRFDPAAISKWLLGIGVQSMSKR